MVYICISLMISDVESLLCTCWLSVYLLWKKCLFTSVHSLFAFLLLISLYILDTSLLSDTACRYVLLFGSSLVVDGFLCFAEPFYLSIYLFI